MGETEMRKTLIYRFSAVAVALLMVMSFAVTSALAEDGGTPETEPVVTITFDYSGTVPGITYKPIHDDNYMKVYWHDGEVHYPGVTVTVTEGDKVTTLVEGEDYSLRFQKSTDMDGDFASDTWHEVPKNQCNGVAIYSCIVDSALDSPYRTLIDNNPDNPSEYYVIYNKPPVNVEFHRNRSEDDDVTEYSGEVPYGGTIREEYIPEFDNPGYDFAGWNTLADGSGQSFDPTAPITLEPTSTDTRFYHVYAQWTEKEPGPVPADDKKDVGPDTGVGSEFPVFMMIILVAAISISEFARRRAER